MSGCAEYCLRVVGLLWAVLGVPGAPSGRVWPVGSGGVASRGCIHTSKGAKAHIDVTRPLECGVRMLVLEKTPQTRHGPFWMSAEILS